MPTSKQTATIRPILYAALESEIGLAFTVSGMSRDDFVTIMGAVKRECNDPTLGELSIFRPPNGEIWVCKRTVALED